MKKEQLTEMVVELLLKEEDPQYISQQAQSLQEGLTNIVEEAKFAKQDSPDNTKAIGGIDWTTLLIAISPVAITELFHFLAGYTNRYKDRRIRVKKGDIEFEISPNNMTPEEIDSYVKQLLKTLNNEV